MTYKLNPSLKVLEETVARTMKDMGSTEANLLHVALGVGGEAGELQDLIKKIAIYKSRKLNDPDVAGSLAYELGDLLWYIELGAKVLGYSMEGIIEMNRVKLELRYPEKFSVEASEAKADKAVTGELE